MSDLPRQYGMEQQFAIYTAGLQGQRPALPLNAEELERRAQGTLSPEAFGYIAGGAGGEDTMRANREAFTRWRIIPRMLRDVAQRDLTTTVLGQTFPAPVLLAPIGVQSSAHPDAEIAVGRSAAALRVPMVLSTASSKPMEAVAAAMGDAPRWYQLYWGRDNEVTKSFLSRAEHSGFSALVVTLDTPLLSWRERDLQNAYLPFLLGQGIANYLSDPAFRASLAKPPEEDPASAVRQFINIFTNPGLTWADIQFLRDNTRLPIVLKGILHYDDARLALEHGVDAVIVSNHGGRQVDGAEAALEALPKVVAAVQGRVPVLFDSGIRRGSDAFKALALGAVAVLYGRPYMYGLALGGEAGVREVLTNFLADFDLTLALSGYRTPNTIDALSIVREAAHR